MAQTIAPSATFPGAEDAPDIWLAPHLCRAAAKTVTFYAMALLKGDVALSVDGRDASEEVRGLHRKLWRLVDNQVSLMITGRPLQAASHEVRRTEEFDVSQALDLSGQDFAALEALYQEEASEPALEAADNSEEAQPLAAGEWRLLWHAVRYRALNGPRQQDRDESRLVSEQVPGMSITGLDQMPWPTSNDWWGEHTPAPTIHPAPPLAPWLIDKSAENLVQ